MQWLDLIGEVLLDLILSVKELHWCILGAT